QSCDLNSSVMTDRTMESVDSMYSSMRSPLPGCSIRDPDLDAKIKEATALASSAEKLQALPYNKLVALHAEMEQLIQVYNESLVQELALKDELEYEKELKNTFISLLLSIQNKRRQFANDRKRKGSKADPAVLPQFITASVPYQDNTGPPDNASLQALIKILRAVNEDNPAVPTILTDYILTVVCPSALSSGFAQ
uniref:Fasciculation and elongation protein zeta 2 n=1 Tax=Plectus sambesii TaxID=2011161 RepID=A0A914UHF5_9BILA